MKYQGEFLVLSKEMNLFEGKYTIYKFVYVSMFVDVRRGERERLIKHHYDYQKMNTQISSIEPDNQQTMEGDLK